MASRIEDYGLIGNLRTGALVSKAGSIDWLCAPRFDSKACFAALVGYDEHGRWSLEPASPVRSRRQRYRGDTLVLETDVTCDEGAYRLIEFMPPGERTDIVRIVEGVEGDVPLQMVLCARFDYGLNRPWATRTADGFSLIAGPDALLIRGPVEMRQTDRGIEADLRLRARDRLPLTLTWYQSHLAEPSVVDSHAELERCERFWSEWVARCTYQGKWREAVVRSLLTLKALTYEPTGAIVAAPTLGLPEEIGGVRNWDYRFCWLRDASLILHALMIGGYVDEATAFRDWVLRAAAGDPKDLQIMYDVTGARRLTELELSWLPGYEDSRPVRSGNAAHDQFQLDVYGETLSAIARARQLGLKRHPAAIRSAQELITHIADVWQRPDDGIWEVRGGRKHFTYSKVMAWVAIDRAVQLLELEPEGTIDLALLSRCRALRVRIHEEVCARGFHAGLNAFTQYYGSEALDASALLIPHSGFLPPHDPRVRSTVKAIESTLMRDGFVIRYDTRHQIDGLPGSEGAFLACSFWLADNYAMVGRLEDAEALMERLLSLRTPLGLLSEEYDPIRRRLIGNFPQGFSHLALIMSAQILSNAQAEAGGPAAIRRRELTT